MAGLYVNIRSTKSRYIRTKTITKIEESVENLWHLSVCPYEIAIKVDDFCFHRYVVLSSNLCRDCLTGILNGVQHAVIEVLRATGRIIDDSG